jgi:hypothetical protein
MHGASCTFYINQSFLCHNSIRKYPLSSVGVDYPGSVTSHMQLGFAQFQQKRPTQSLFATDQHYNNTTLRSLVAVDGYGVTLSLPKGTYKFKLVSQLRT